MIKSIQVYPSPQTIKLNVAFPSPKCNCLPTNCNIISEMIWSPAAKLFARSDAIDNSTTKGIQKGSLSTAFSLGKTAPTWCHWNEKYKVTYKKATTSFLNLWSSFKCIQAYIQLHGHYWEQPHKIFLDKSAALIGLGANHNKLSISTHNRCRCQTIVLSSRAYGREGATASWVNISFASLYNSSLII